MKTLATLGILLGISGSLLAGEKNSLVEPEPACWPLSGTVSVGYDSSYLFRGGRYGDQAPWGELDLNLEVTPAFLFNAGVKYINPTGVAVVGDELDVYGYLIVPVTLPGSGEWEAGVGGTLFYFLEDEDDGSELNLFLTKAVGEWFDFTFEYTYDLSYDGHAFGYYLDKSIPLRPCLDLDLGAGAGHADENYNFDVLAGDFAYVRAGLTWHLTETAQFSSYVLGNFPFGGLEEAGERSDCYWGGSLGVAF